MVFSAKISPESHLILRVVTFILEKIGKVVNQIDKELLDFGLLENDIKWTSCGSEDSL